MALFVSNFGKLNNHAALLDLNYGYCKKWPILPELEFLI